MDSKGQICLDFRPKAAAADPATSRAADEDALKKGVKQRHCEIIYEALRLHNGSTTAELARYCRGLNYIQVARRMIDLEENELIRRGEKGQRRPCEVRGRVCETWWLK